MSDFKIYAFLGRKHSGKDTYAKKLIGDDDKIISLAFAEHIKQTLAVMFNIRDMEVFHDQKRKETERIWGNFTARDLMCWYGDTMRERFGSNFFADIVRLKIYDAIRDGYRAAVITDLRFISELGMIVGLNLPFQIFYVDRDSALGKLPANAALSEKSVLETLDYMRLKNIPFTLIDNNCTYDEIDDVYNSLSII